MRGPGWALTWEFWSRHRLDLSLWAAYTAAVAVVFNALPAGSIDWQVGGVLAVPVVAGLAYLLIVLSHGTHADLLATESGFPRRLMTLPVSTPALSGWPLLAGTASLAVGWPLAVALVLRPCGIHLPLVWPIVAGAALLAWSQATSWMPFPLPGMRLVANVLAIVPVVTLGVLGHMLSWPAEWMLAGSAVALVGGAVAAPTALARARRGEGERWTWATTSVPSPRRPFDSALAAQEWYEWRQHGLNFPLMVGLSCLTFFPLAFLVEPAHAAILLGVIIPFYPLLMAEAAGSTLTATRSSLPGRLYVHALTPFLATRPLTTAKMVWAKFYLALLSTLAVWAFVLPTALIGLLWLRTLHPEHVWMAPVADFVREHTLACVLAVSLCLPALTWRMMTSTLWIGLLGMSRVHDWVVLSQVLLLPLSVAFGVWLFLQPEWREVVAVALPWVLAALVVLKLAAGVWVLRTLARSGLMRQEVVWKLAACWVVLTAVAVGLACWLTPGELVPWPVTACVAVLVMPLVRQALAPLALDRNRHR